MKTFTRITGIGIVFLSGLAMAIISAYFGISGFMDLIPVPEFFFGILALGIVLEVGKNVVAVLLFHVTTDSEYPGLMKVWLWTALLVSMGLSMVFTYTHLYEPFARDSVQVETASDRSSEIKLELAELAAERKTMNTQVAELPENFSRARSDLIKSFAPRLAEIREDEGLLKKELSAIRDEKKEKGDETDILAFANSIGSNIGMDGKDLYSLIILFVVLIIDPFALGFAISASFLLTQYNLDRTKDSDEDTEKEEREKERKAQKELEDAEWKREKERRELELAEKRQEAASKVRSTIRTNQAKRQNDLMQSEPSSISKRPNRQTPAREDRGKYTTMTQD